jgi:hypothetical protein
VAGDVVEEGEEAESVLESGEGIVFASAALETESESDFELELEPPPNILFKSRPP